MDELLYSGLPVTRNQNGPIKYVELSKCSSYPLIYDKFIYYEIHIFYFERCNSFTGKIIVMESELVITLYKVNSAAAVLIINLSNKKYNYAVFKTDTFQELVQR